MADLISRCRRRPHPTDYRDSIGTCGSRHGGKRAVDDAANRDEFGCCALLLKHRPRLSQSTESKRCAHAELGWRSPDRPKLHVVDASGGRCGHTSDGVARTSKHSGPMPGAEFVLQRRDGQRLGRMQPSNARDYRRR